MMKSGRVQLVLLFIFLWLLVVFYLQAQSGRGGNTEEMAEISRQLRSSLEDVQKLKTRNDELTSMIKTLRSAKFESLGREVDGVNKEVEKINEQLDNAETDKTACQEQVKKLQGIVTQLQSLEGAADGHALVEGGKHGLIDTPGVGPSAEHEEVRMRLANNIQELWFYMKAQLKKISPPSQAITNILEDIGHHHRSMMVDLMALGQADNADAWREQEHSELQNLMQRRLQHLQNPKDCNGAKKLVCNINKGCGYGCQLHHVVYCFMIAYGTERTMILESQGWRYARSGWESVFQPVSTTCTSLPSGQNAVSWHGEENSAKELVVSLPIVDAIAGRPPYMPLSIPADLAPRLSRLHADPSVWFIGQFIKYLLRPQPALQQDMDDLEKKFGFKNPIVGIHVRRTDKVGTEAAFHGVEEYMEHVDAWYELQERTEGRIDKRRVYLASDDPLVLPDARSKYRNYEFFGDTSISKSAGMASRYSDNSLRGVIMDIHFLSKCDYLVCTFSSQVCRVAYEIMQTLHPDPSQWFHSLDDIYYFGGQGAHEETAMYKNSKRTQDEIDLEPGDVVGIAGNHWDGYSKGQNRRTGAIGLYPSYKTKDKRVIVNYPTYADINSDL